MDIIVSALVAASAGFGVAYFLIHKWLMPNEFKGAFYIKMLLVISIGIGLTGLIQQFLMNPMLGLKPDVDKAAKYLIANIIVLPVLIFFSKFFIALLSPKKSTKREHDTLFDTRKEEGLWEQVSEELRMGKRVDSIWIRAYSDADGDTVKANARYIKLRVEQLRNEIDMSRDIQEKPPSIKSTSNNKANPPKIFNTSVIYKIFFVSIPLTLLMFYLFATPLKQSTNVENSTASNVNTIQAHLKKCNLIYIEQKDEFWVLESDPKEMSGLRMYSAIVPGKEGRAGALVGMLERETNQTKRIELENELATISANFYYPAHLSKPYHPAYIYQAIQFCNLNAK